MKLKRDKMQQEGLKTITAKIVNSSMIPFESNRHIDVNNQFIIA